MPLAKSGTANQIKTKAATINRLILEAFVGKPSLSSLAQLSGKYPSTAIGCNIVPLYKEFCIAALTFNETELTIIKIGPP
jgi:hypothetical protein